MSALSFKSHWDWVSQCISRGIDGAPGITLEAVTDNSGVEGFGVLAKSNAYFNVIGVILVVMAEKVAIISTVIWAVI